MSTTTSPSGNLLNLPKYRLKYLNSISTNLYRLLKSEVPFLSELEFLNAQYFVEQGALSIYLSNDRLIRLAVGTSGARIMETNLPILQGREVRFNSTLLTERINRLLQSAVHDIVKASNDKVLTFEFSIPYGYLKVKTYRGKTYILKSEGGR
jgi:hypothetical protein